MMKKKSYKHLWVYGALALVLGLIIWLFIKSAGVDVCTQDLNSCLVQSKRAGGFSQFASGFMCVIYNVWCLMTGAL